jgi:RND superfamily putative drug exporter
VAIGLGGLLFYQGTFLASLGVAGAVVVGCAIFYALTFLPALLALLGPRVNAWRLPLGRPRSGHGFWHALAHGVMRRPLVVLALTLPVVLAAGAPFVGIRLATADQRALPPQAETHRGVDLLIKEFPGQAQTQIAVVVDYPTKGVLSAARVGALYDLSRRIARLPDVLRVEGPVDMAPTLSRSAYQSLYARPAAALPPAARQVVRQSVGTRIAVLTVLTARTATSDQARALVRAIRSLGRAGDGRILVTGKTASDVDTVALILGRTPAAMGFIMVMTYLVLFLLLGSVLLPLKALVTDVLSIMASFGALVWVFQDGHLSKVLNFTSASIDPAVPVLLFCIVFGLSMDYEVLLLSRMKEEYERTGNTRGAVAAGLEHSGRLITGAAAIMVVVFLAFGLADTVTIKSIGLGMALAVAVDATLVRALIVPAIMRLLGDLNWWTPRPLAHLHERLNLGEGAQPSGESVAAAA